MLREAARLLIPEPRVSLKLSKYRLCDGGEASHELWHPAEKVMTLIWYKSSFWNWASSLRPPWEPLFIYLLTYLLRKQRGTGARLWVSQEV